MIIGKTGYPNKVYENFQRKIAVTQIIKEMIEKIIITIPAHLFNFQSALATKNKKIANAIKNIPTTTNKITPRPIIPSKGVPINKSDKLDIKNIIRKEKIPNKINNTPER